MKEFWDDRYSKSEFGFGEEPNVYLKEKIVKFNKGKILFPAEGEGRNGVYAAGLGWDVYAFDLSGEGKKKAEILANKNQVKIQYEVGDFNSIRYFKEEFDAIGIIFAHFPLDVKAVYHKQLISYLKKDGIIILECFSKNHLQYNQINNSGGPKELDRLYSKEEILEIYQGFEILELEETVYDLKEGIYHDGTGSVIRFLGRKK